ncbi:SH3 domain-containing protein [Falsiroseomonas oryzae]|uniref:SH3 domain-containing protein n=1 Tax=Falsiroseomonas oryzae TaxID=2766473 RepID=UPI0022EB2E8F|nr:SH3 domain-containing protein [Roseomonas sp. MO-31]
MLTRIMANVREGPGISTPSVRVVPQGITLRLYARSGSWMQVGDQEPWGWIHASLVAPVP